MNPTTLRLSAMMFIQFFIWGAWYVTGPLYLGPLGFKGGDFGWMYSVGPIAGMISPFFVGMIADRFFATERVLGVMHLGAAGAMFVAIAMMSGDKPNPSAINLMFFLHMLCYFPTLALTNTLAMKNITSSEKQFPLIRVFGTIGWIAAGLTVSYFGWDTKVNMFHLAAGAALLMGVYSFSLPHTPPTPTETKPTLGQLLGLDALVMLKNPSFAVFMASSFLICIPLAFYYQMAAKVVQQAELVPGRTMSFGQMSEIVFMLVMPLFFARLGVKWMLAVGMLAWVVRYGLFTVGAPDQVIWMILAGVLLHGICYDFFFVTGQIYTDKSAPTHIRGQAQGMLVLFTLGLGMFIGAQVGGQVEAAFTPKKTLWLQAESGAIAKHVGQLKENLAKMAASSGHQPFVEFSNEDTASVQKEIDAVNERIDALTANKAPEAELAPVQQELAAKLAQKISILESQSLEYSKGEAQLLDTQIRHLDNYQSSKAVEALRLVDWKSVWMWPAVGAGVILILFCLVFKDRSTKQAGVTDGDVAKGAAAEEQP